MRNILESFRLAFLLILTITASILIHSIGESSDSVLAASGQNRPAERQVQPYPGASGSGIQILSAEIAGKEDLVTNLPYVATATVETIQTLGNNNRIVSRSTQDIMRDSKGRTRREQSIGRVGSLEFNGPKMIFISDPSAGTEYILDPGKHTFRITKPRNSLSADAASRARLEEKMTGTQTASGASQRRQVRHESLGNRDIEQLNAEGQRITSTIPVGLLGNDKSFEISLETWYSPELHVYLYRKRSDPRIGETVYRLTNIRRIEPDPKLFQIPPGYKQIPNTSAGPE